MENLIPMNMPTTSSKKVPIEKKKGLHGFTRGVTWMGVGRRISVLLEHHFIRNGWPGGSIELTTGSWDMLIVVKGIVRKDRKSIALFMEKPSCMS